MKKYILFDNDGVLVETEKWYFLANYEVLQEMGIHLDEASYLQIMIKGESAFSLAEQNGFSPSEIETAKMRRNLRYQHYIQSEDITIKGVKEVLHALSSRYQMGIVTSSRLEDFELIHRKKELTQYMDFVLCSGEYPRSKPHPDPYLSGLKRFGATKEQSIIVEDSQRGLNSAYAAGIECVIVDNPFTRAHDFSQATYCIEHLGQLEALLHSL